MPTLVLPPRYTEDSRALRDAAVRAGWHVERLLRWRVEGEVAEPVLYGEPLFVAVVAPQLGLAMLEPPLDWLPGLPERLLRRRVECVPLGQARARPGPVFVKPADEKAFVAKVWESGAALPGPDELPDHVVTLVAEPVAWSLEVRCFVVEGEVVTASPYLRDGVLVRAPDGSWPAAPEELAEALALAREVVAAVELPPAVTLDVGLVTGRGWAVVEANPCWGSGIYGCDPAEVLRAARRASVPAASITEADARWVVTRRGDEAPPAGSA